MNIACLAAASLLLSAAGATANVSMPVIFGNHMVLQQGIKLPLWGLADPGEEVSVSVGSSQGKTTADSTGKWRVELAPLAVSGTPVQVEVKGKNTLTFTDVLVGDVWLCAGQSNMEFGIGNAANAKQAIPEMNFPNLRMFLIPRTIAWDPASDIRQDGMKGQWVVCTPESVVKIGGWNGFSAIGLFFAREIHELRKEPVGIIGACWGGTPLKNWTSVDVYRKNSDLARFAAEYDTTKPNFATMLEQYKTETVPKWQAEHDAWKHQVSLLQNGEAKPKEPKKPDSPDAYPSLATVLFNGMIHPLIPYGLKGVIWYQGESNGSTPEDRRDYGKNFAAMITDWRERWGEGNFPFLFVQIAGWEWGYFSISIRNSQLNTLSLPKTGMAVAIDLGDPNDVHPKDKATPAHRLVLAARHVAYGEDLVYSGPIYSGSEVEGNNIRIRFTRTGSGLMIGTSPGKTLDPATPLQGFEIAGSSGLFEPAQAEIDGDSVLVWSPKIEKPKIVQYAWAGLPKPAANLYNKEGLPASPFWTKDAPPTLAPDEKQAGASTTSAAR